MEIRNGNAFGLEVALGLIRARPNPLHLLECKALTGKDADINALLRYDLEASRAVAFAADGEDALVCGLSVFGDERIPVWMTTTKGIERRPRWLWRNTLQCWKSLDQLVTHGTVYWPWVPEFYTLGLNFARHLGPVIRKRRPSPATGAMLCLMEREVR